MQQPITVLRPRLPAGLLASILACLACPTASAQGTAATTAYGTGCGGASDFATYYEFGATPFDLVGTPGNEFVLQHNFIGNGYLVLAGTPAWHTPTSADLGLQDDDNSPQLPLGFTMPLPTGTSISTVSVCSNGYIWAQSSTNTSYTPQLTEFLNETTRYAPCWVDLQPGSGGGAGTIHFDSMPGAAYVTYQGIQEYNTPGSTIDMQVAFFPSGVVEYRYRTNTITRPPIVGWTPGNGAADPGSVDISATPVIITAPDANRPNMTLQSGRPVEGSAMSVNVTDIPANAVFGAFIISGTQVIGGTQPIPGLGRCSQFVGPFDTVYFLPTGTMFSRTIPIPAASFRGMRFYAQAVVLAAGVNPAGIVTSNGLEWLIDIN